MESAQAKTTLSERLHERFGDVLAGCTEREGHVTCDVRPGSLLEVCQVLRDAPEFSFEQLMDLAGSTTGVRARGVAHERGHQYRLQLAAWSDGRSRRELPRRSGPRRVSRSSISCSRSRLNQRLRLRCYLSGDPPRAASVVEIWSSANWFEREAFDLFGILFEGHPDLRRILTDYGFIGHPFRKDFPLIGQVEVRYDPEKRRVVYEPVSIEPRTLVPRVIRHDDHRCRCRPSGKD
jgi:NADH-quinone oxidoreductase subunit C